MSGYLLETTERFGMETRTELILLQRTMVVVEGVARTLDPEANIFEAAKPVVEDYIRKNLGPAAVLTNMRDTAEILMRIGPRLPGLASELLMLAEETRLKRSLPPPTQTGRLPSLLSLGAATLAGALIASLIILI